MRSGRSLVSFSDLLGLRDMRHGWLHCNPMVSPFGTYCTSGSGSAADWAIDPKSLAVNNFAEVFADYPTITRM